MALLSLLVETLILRRVLAHRPDEDDNSVQCLRVDQDRILAWLNDDDGFFGLILWKPFCVYSEHNTNSFVVGRSCVAL
jgi:hypothetical protein